MTTINNNSRGINPQEVEMEMQTFSSNVEQTKPEEFKATTGFSGPTAENVSALKPAAIASSASSEVPVSLPRVDRVPKNSNVAEVASGAHVTSVAVLTSQDPVEVEPYADFSDDEVVYHEVEDFPDLESDDGVIYPDLESDDGVIYYDARETFSDSDSEVDAIPSPSTAVSKKNPDPVQVPDSVPVQVATTPGVAPVAPVSAKPVDPDLIKKANELIANAGDQKQPKVLADVMKLFTDAGHKDITIDFAIDQSKTILNTDAPNLQAVLKNGKTCYNVSATFTINVEGQPITYKKWIPTDGQVEDAALFAVAAYGKLVKDGLAKKLDPSATSSIEAPAGMNIENLDKISFGFNHDSVGRVSSIKEIKAGDVPFILNNYTPRFSSDGREKLRSEFGSSANWIQKAQVNTLAIVTYPTLAELTAQKIDMNKYIEALTKNGEKRIALAEKLKKPFKKDPEKLSGLISDLQANKKQAIDPLIKKLPETPQVEKYREMKKERDALILSNKDDPKIAEMKNEMKALAKEINKINQGLLDQLDRLCDVEIEISALATHIRSLINELTEKDGKFHVPNMSKLRRLGTLEKLITKETKEIESTIKMVESAMKDAGLPFRKRQATVIVG